MGMSGVYGRIGCLWKAGFGSLLLVAFLLLVVGPEAPIVASLLLDVCSRWGADVVDRAASQHMLDQNLRRKPLNFRRKPLSTTP